MRPMSHVCPFHPSPWTHFALFLLSWAIFQSWRSGCETCMWWWTNPIGDYHRFKNYDSRPDTAAKHELSHLPANRRGKCGKWSTAHCCNRMLQIIRQIIMINHKLKERARACMCICLCVYARSRESTLMKNSLKQIFVFISNNSRLNHSTKFAFENRIINKYEDLNHYITQQQTIFISISHTYTLCHERSGT